MKIKRLIIFCVIGIIILFFVSIFVGKKFLVKVAVDDTQNENKTYEETKSAVSQNEISNSNQKEYTNIVTNSKIGVELQNLIKIANIYSYNYFKILDENNSITDDAKRLFVYSRIVTSDEYESYIRYSDKYVGSYVTKKDFDEISKKIFGESINLEGRDILSENSFDEENNNYVINPIGICGNDVMITVDVPYKMLEYDDKIEVYVYRLYITQNVQSLEDSVELKNDIYADEERKNLLISITDDTLLDENLKTYNLLDKIEEGKILTDTLKKGVYTIKTYANNKYIDSYKEM